MCEQNMRLQEGKNRLSVRVAVAADEMDVNRRQEFVAIDYQSLGNLCKQVMYKIWVNQNIYFYLA
jgi:hypothetical protein